MEKTFLGKEDEGLDTAGNPAPVARQQGTSEDSKDSEGRYPYSDERTQSSEASQNSMKFEVQEKQTQLGSVCTCFWGKLLAYGLANIWSHIV